MNLRSSYSVRDSHIKYEKGSVTRHMATWDFSPSLQLNFVSETPHVDDEFCTWATNRDHHIEVKVEEKEHQSVCEQLTVHLGSEHIVKALKSLIHS